MGILGELSRAGLLHDDSPTVHSSSIKQALEQWDICLTKDADVKQFYQAGPAGIPTQTAFSQSTRWPSLDADRANGCIRTLEHAYSLEGGLAVLFGNIATDGCVVKTSGVDDSILVFQDQRIFAKAKTAPFPIFWKTVLKKAMWLSFAMRGHRAGRVCKKCSILPVI